MPLVLDNPSVPSDLVDPKNLKLDPLRGEDFDASSTLRTATANATGLYLDGQPVAGVSGVTGLDLAFDTADEPLFLYTTAAGVFLYRDGATTNFGTGVEPRAHNDRQAAPSVILSYQRGNDVFYREDRDAYAEEYLVDDGTPLAVRTLTGAALGTNDRYQFRGLPVATAAENTGSGTGSTFFAANVPTFQPNFLRIFKHLLPRAKAWRLTIDKTLRKFFEGLAPIGDGVKAYADAAFLDIDPQLTTSLEEWEKQFNLADTGLTEQERRDRLAAAWQATGSLSPRYLQDVLQGLGFDVYVHEWWAPGSEPAVGIKECVTPRDPFDYLTASNNASSPGVDCGEPLAACGEDFAQAGNTTGNVLGYPLVNKVKQTRPAYLVDCGEPTMECGEPDAVAGNYSTIIDEFREYQLPTDPAKWPYFVYIGAQNFPELATLPASRRAEFEATLLKYCPAHLWIGVLVTYS